MTNQEIIAKAIENMSNEEKEILFPPIERKNFVVRKSWLGRNQIISFKNDKGQCGTYNHDEALDLLLPMLDERSSWKETGEFSLTNIDSLPNSVKKILTLKIIK
tara:strand:- start:282 stop:593 length:312 start_codon:yes stop_codon:yes gene_type:complete